MNIIYLETLQAQLTKNFNLNYIFLGEDVLFLKKNEDLILKFAKKRGFIQKISINIEKNIDWNKIFVFYKLENLFFKKSVLIINIHIKSGNLLFINNINKIFFISDINILVILKLYTLSKFFIEKKNLKKIIYDGTFISCFTPDITCFKSWIKYEIQERKIIIEKESIELIYQSYEGNVLFINQMLDILTLTWPNKNITVQKIKKIIDNFSIFSPTQWVNSIFDGEIDKSIYILNTFFQQKKNPLLLVRTLQNDLLKILYIQREKKININILFKKYNIWNTRYKYFIHAYQNIHFKKLFKAIKILVQIEILIKKEHNDTVWLQLKTLTLILCS